MIGIQYNLVDSEAIYQGADWEKEFQIFDPTTGKPSDLSDYIIESQARKKYTDELPSIEFTCSLSTDGTDGKITLSLTNAETSAIPQGNYKYDVEAIEPSPGTKIYKIITPSIVQVVEEYTQ